MNKVTDPNTVHEALHKICKHALFANSSVYSPLLTYLVKKALDKEDVKEFTIGADLFTKNYNYDKNDGTVRSHMYNLRKKLAEYYQKEGADDPLIFRISKGQYNLEFVTNEALLKPQIEHHPTVTISIQKLKLAAICIVVFALGLLLAWRYTQQAPQLWEAFFDSESQNIVIISDQYVVHQKLADGELHSVIYPEINNNEQFIAYTAKNQDRSLLNTDYTLMSKMAPYCIKNITEWFEKYQSKFELKLESNLKYEDIRNTNLIFIGQSKTMTTSKSVFLKDSNVFTLYRDGFKYAKNGVEKVYDTKYNQSNRVEYAMVSCTSLSPGKTALYFVSNNDIGVMATLHNFTNKVWLDQFQSQLTNKTKHFNALFEVSGLQRTDVSCKMVALEQMP